MNPKRTVKSFAVCQTAGIAAIVTAALTGLASMTFLVVTIFVRLSHLSGPSHPYPYGLRGLFLICTAIPFFYGLGAFIVTAMACWLYNVLSPRFGQIAIEFAVPREISE